MTDENKFEKRIKNAVIAEVFIGFDDKKAFTSWVVLNFGKHKQGFGGVDLAQKDAAFKFFTNLLTIVGTQSVNELVGKAVRVYHDSEKAYSLGNYVEDKWLAIDTLTTSSHEHPNGVTETVDAEGKKHYGIAAETIPLGAELNQIEPPKTEAVAT